jgi:hypothetical protein
MFTRRARLLGRTAVFASMITLTLGALTATDADARQLRWHGGGWHGGGPAAAAAIAGAVGTGLAIAASRDAYAYDYGGPAYYGGGPVYYGGPAYSGYYGNGYYGGYTYGNYPYQLYGGDSPYAVCAQGTTWNCQ